MDETKWQWTDMTIAGPFWGTKGMWQQVLAEKRGSRVRLSAQMHAHGLWRLLLPLIDRSAKQELES